ncbi:MAG: formylmethanofuran dehydrogenase subunit E family protein [Desulfobacterales bacterium]|nr:formylmethanofuran dehydrogenase subunit E family protein [Desulfobacterales bacterium]
MICGKTIDEFLSEIMRFHGFKAPGIVLGGIMVDYCQELIGAGVEADAIVESIHCLPDAVQLFTPCTVGNGWLKVLDWDKYALSLYNRKTVLGFRIWVDTEKTKSYPDLYNWYMRLVPKKELSSERVINAIFTAERNVLSYQAIQITQHSDRHKKGETGICSSCGEAYSLKQGTSCLSCQGHCYYIKNPN